MSQIEKVLCRLSTENRGPEFHKETIAKIAPESMKTIPGYIYALDVIDSVYAASILHRTAKIHSKVDKNITSKINEKNVIFPVFMPEINEAINN
jgi:hypothetical protein